MASKIETADQNHTITPDITRPLTDEDQKFMDSINATYENSGEIEKTKSITEKTLADEKNISTINTSERMADVISTGDFNQMLSEANRLALDRNLNDALYMAKTVYDKASSPFKKAESATDIADFYFQMSNQDTEHRDKYYSEAEKWLRIANEIIDKNRVRSIGSIAVERTVGVAVNVINASKWIKGLFRHKPNSNKV